MAGTPAVIGRAGELLVPGLTGQATSHIATRIETLEPRATDRRLELLVTEDLIDEDLALALVADSLE